LASLSNRAEVAVVAAITFVDRLGFALTVAYVADT